MLPKGWTRMPLSACAKFISGNTPSKEDPSLWGGNFPWVTAKDMKSLHVGKAGICLTEKGKGVACIAPENSILVLTRGMTLLKDLPICLASREVAFNQDVKALLPSKTINASFLAYQLITSKKEILDLVDTAGHGTGRLDTDLLKNYEVAIAPLAEQQRIASILDTSSMEIEAFERYLNILRTERSALMRQLLTGKRRVRLPRDQRHHTHEPLPRP
jgi:type I restriction enzyme S subunit